MRLHNALQPENAKYLPLAALGLAQAAYEMGVKPHLTATKGWLCVAGLVAAYEIAAPEGELLSEGVDRALQAHPYLTKVAIGVTALHLLNVLPPQIDPFHQVLKAIK